MGEEEQGPWGGSTWTATNNPLQDAIGELLEAETKQISDLIKSAKQAGIGWDIHTHPAFIKQENGNIFMRIDIKYRERKDKEIVIYSHPAVEKEGE